MYKQQNRLTKKNDFDNVYKNGKASFDNLIGVKVVANHLDISRFGIVVSKKVSKSAVKRNTVKRRLRTAIKAKIENFKPGYDCVVIAQSAVVEQKYSGIEDALYKHFKRLQLI